MINFIKNIQKISIFAIIAMFFVIVPNKAFADFNTLPNDCPTASVANYTTQANIASRCWASSVSASPGDLVIVRVYYHNTANSPANATLSLNNPQGSKISNYNFTGWINGATPGSASINLSSAQTLTLDSVEWFPENQNSTSSPLPSGQSASAILSSGLNLGTILGMNTCTTDSFCHAGFVNVFFKVGQTSAPACAINSFTINGNQTYANVSYGNTASLSWSTSNCSNVTLNGSSVSASNTINTSALTATTNYVLKVFDSSGNQVNQRAVTAVVSGSAPVCTINSFTANGTSGTLSVSYGTSVNLAWSTSNCSSVVVNGVTYTGGQASAGGVSLGTLTSSATYNMSASGTSGNPYSSVTVNVGSQPTVCSISSFTVNDSSSATISYNTSATLAWSTSNCTNVTLNGNSQSTSNSISTGNLTSPVNTYTLVARDNNGNTDSKVVIVNVNPANTGTCTINSFTANGTSGTLSVSYGTSVNLAWSTSNCSSVVVNGVTYTGGQASAGNINLGTLSSGNYIYSIFAVDNYGHTTNGSLSVNVSGNNNNNSYCQITAFSPLQSYVTSGYSTTLTWTLSGCTGAVSLSGPNFSNQQIYGSSISTGPIYSNSTYTLTAYGSNGSPVTSQTYVYVNNNYYNNSNCYISSFTANGMSTAQVSYGSTATISWNTNGCSTVTVSGPGVYSQNGFGSMSTSAIYGYSTYTITAYGTYYSNPQTQTVSVNTYSNYTNPTPTYVYPTQNQYVPTSVNPITTIATNVNTTSARLNGIVPQNNSITSVTAYFQYGTDQSLGQQTNQQTVATYTLLNYYDTISTSPNTTYYYRAVMNTNGVITQGSIVSFTTPATQSNPVVVQQITYGTGTGSTYGSISINDQYQIVSPGDALSYTITYKNISNQELSNAVINVILPKGVTYKASTQGMPTTDNTIMISLGTLSKNAEGTINVQASVDNSVSAGNNLLATATLSFTTASGAQDSAVGYYMNTVTGNSANSLGAFALFGYGFFPTTLLGWVILIGIILIIILVIRHFIATTPTKNNNSDNGHSTDMHH